MYMRQYTTALLRTINNCADGISSVSTSYARINYVENIRLHVEFTRSRVNFQPSTRKRKHAENRSRVDSKYFTRRRFLLTVNLERDMLTAEVNKSLEVHHGKVPEMLV